MPYCAYCGTQVAPGTAFCPTCANPPSGVRQPAAPAAVVKGPSSGITLVIILLVGGFFLIAVMGILAALIIPNFLDALQKAKQKRTVADLREVGTAIVSYSTDNNGALPPGKSLEEVGRALVPKYVASVPAADGWKRPFRYACWQKDSNSSGCNHFRIASGGRDGLFEKDDLSQYPEESFAMTDYDRDIVFGDGAFIQYPGGSRQPR